MARGKFHITAEQETELKTAYQQSTDTKLSKKVLAIRMYGTGHPVKIILDLVGCNRVTLLKWCGQYSQLGLAGLADQRKGGNHHKLTPVQKADLRERLHRYTPRSFRSRTACRREATAPSHTTSRCPPSEPRRVGPSQRTSRRNSRRRRRAAVRPAPSLSLCCGSAAVPRRDPSRSTFSESDRSLRLVRPSCWE